MTPFNNKMSGLNRAILGWLIAASLTPVCVGAEETSMFRGDPAHSGVLLARAPQNLSVKWTFHTADVLVSSPTVANGVVYIGSSDNFLYAVDARSGELKWKFNAHGNVSSSPAATPGAIFALSLDGNLYAVDAASGVQKWSFATEGERRHSARGMEYAAPRPN